MSALEYSNHYYLQQFPYLQAKWEHPRYHHAYFSKSIDNIVKSIFKVILLEYLLCSLESPLYVKAHGFINKEIKSLEHDVLINDLTKDKIVCFLNKLKKENFFNTWVLHIKSHDDLAGWEDQICNSLSFYKEKAMEFYCKWNRDVADVEVIEHPPLDLHAPFYGIFMTDPSHFYSLKLSASAYALFMAEEKRAASHIYFDIDSNLIDQLHLQLHLWGYQVVEKPRKGDLALYFDEETQQPVHVAFCITKDRVVSKFNKYENPCKHELFDCEYYDKKVVFYRNVK